MCALRRENIKFRSLVRMLSIGGSRGGGRQGRAPPPRPQNFFIFMQFSGKIGQIIGWRPPPRELAPPPRGNPGSATAEELLVFCVFYW